MFLVFLLVVSVIGQHQQGKSTIEIGNFVQCNGKDSNNYTFIYPYITLTDSCTDVIGLNDTVYLVASSNGQIKMNIMKPLAQSEFPAGGHFQYESLMLVQSGPLEGKYVYLKERGLTNFYLKKCSSVLANSHLFLKHNVLLIAEKLDLNIFLNAGGAYESFKKIASTVCQERNERKGCAILFLDLVFRLNCA